MYYYENARNAELFLVEILADTVQNVVMRSPKMMIYNELGSKQKILPTTRYAWQILSVSSHMVTKGEFDFSAQSSMSSIGSHVLNVLFVLVRRF